MSPITKHRAGECEQWLDAICDHHDLTLTIERKGPFATAIVTDELKRLVCRKADRNVEDACDKAIANLRRYHLASQPECCLGSKVVPSDSGFSLTATCGDCLGGGETDPTVGGVR